MMIRSGSSTSWFGMADHRPRVVEAMSCMLQPAWSGPAGESTPPSYRFPRLHRLRGRAAFGRVYAARVNRRCGPLVFHAVPTSLPYWRFGLSVSKRVGNAVRRNRIKRLIREGFRLHRHAWPGSYDLVVVVLPHAPRHLDDYVAWMSSGAEKLHRAWVTHAEKKDRGGPAGS